VNHAGAAPVNEDPPNDHAARILATNGYDEQSHKPTLHGEAMKNKRRGRENQENLRAVKRRKKSSWCENTNGASHEETHNASNLASAGSSIAIYGAFGPSCDETGLPAHCHDQLRVVPQGHLAPADTGNRGQRQINGGVGHSGPG
jgi:hypothetical protein